MPEVIRLRKGLDIKLKGAAPKECVVMSPATSYGLGPDDFTGITPKVVVAPGQEVKAGEALFVNKKHPEMKFVSPVAGTVTGVNRGARRKVMSITVAPNGKDEAVTFGVKSVHSLNVEQVKEMMLESGVFAFVRQRPFDIVANPDDTPKAIFVSAFDSAPLAPDFEFVMKGREADFQTGLSALAKLAPTFLGISSKQSDKVLTDANNAQVTTFKGPHPAGNVGVQINHIKPVNKGEIVWTVAAQDVLIIGSVFNSGKVDFTRTIALAGTQLIRPTYAKVTFGAKIADVLGNNDKMDRHNRIINGNVLTGVPVKRDGFLGAFANMITVIPEGDDVNEMMGWMAPRFNHFSVSRTFFSFLTPNRKYDIDARIKGGERHMIASGEYDKVFPMDIYPEYLIKAIITGDVDKMEAMGIYEVAPEDFALCEFVDSSKLEVQRIVREGLDKLRAEME
jgi:Na+-transporting NADH:ubiquinone oxidoreductase subunit A